MSRMLRTRVAFGLVMASFTLLNAGVPGYILPAYGQTQPELRKMVPQFVTEPGCPVQVMAASTDLEVDPFGTPMAARHYIDYKNVSGAPVAAVKFRIGYIADDGMIHQPYLNAPDAHTLNPGDQASQKWRGEKVDPRTREIKIRVLMVKMADGSVWESQKINQTTQQQQQGFMPLTTEGGNGDIASGDVRMPGTPVPLTDTGKSYQAFPQQTQTGPANFKPVQTPAAGFEPNAFGAGGAPSTAVTPSAPAWGDSAAPAGTAGFQPAGSAGFQPAPSSAAAGFQAAPPTAAPAASGFAPAAPSGSAGFQPAPTAASGFAPAAPSGSAGFQPAPSAAPAASGFTPAAPAAAPPAPPTAASIADPVAEFDKLMGNSPKPASAPAAAPIAAPSAPPAVAPAAPEAAPATPAAPAAQAPTAAPADAAPAAAPPSAAPQAGGDDFTN